MLRFTITFLIAGQASRFAHDENGATAIEYAMIAAGVGAAVASAVMTLGTSVNELFFERLATALE
jgi:pilus assembly protein Flp/PilA